MILLLIPFYFCYLLSTLPLFSLSQNNSSSPCIHTCGTRRVPYPFGFSSTCPIQLNCTGIITSNGNRDGDGDGDVSISGFPVHNLTSDHIVLSIPQRCNRSIHDLAVLFGRNYAPTWRNSLLLENCTSGHEGCVILNNLTRARLGIEHCEFGPGNGGGENGTVGCYSDGLDFGSGFLDYEAVRRRSCNVVFSSVLMGLDETNSTVSLELRTMELGWWMNGNCSGGGGCDPGAICTPVEGRGYRCTCRDGFAGDGFSGGRGCYQVSNCNNRWFGSSRCGSRIGILIGGVVAGASLAVVLAVIFFCVRRRSKTLQSRLSARRLLSDAAGNNNVPFYPYKEIERATNGFSEKQRLGTGAYGTVYSGKLHDNECVAIKRIRYRDHDSIEQVMNEIKLLSSVSHPNLVRLLGCCIENGEQILVYEYMANGTLSQHLQRERGSVLPWTVRLTIAAETARAIAHLHSAMDPPIYHRDVKSTNILLDRNFNSKVADFGLSRSGMTDDSHISTAPQGTPGYVDPQYHQNYHLSDKSDVYSFGVVLVEIITAMKVVDFSRPHSEINLAALAIDRIGKGRVDDIIDPFLEPNRDAWTLSSVHKVAELAFRCLAFHRDMRPSMMEVADELEQIRVSGWAPMDDHVCMGSSVASSCSSPYLGSEKSVNTTRSKKAGLSSRRLIVPQKGFDVMTRTVEVKDTSPVSVQEIWLSEQSSPSTNSLLGNVAR